MIYETIIQILIYNCIKHGLLNVLLSSCDFMYKVARKIEN